MRNRSSRIPQVVLSLPVSGASGHHADRDKTKSHPTLLSAKWHRNGIKKPSPKDTNPEEHVLCQEAQERPEEDVGKQCEGNGCRR